MTSDYDLQRLPAAPHGVLVIPDDMPYFPMAEGTPLVVRVSETCRW